MFKNHKKLKTLEFRFKNCLFPCEGCLLSIKKSSKLCKTKARIGYVWDETTFFYKKANKQMRWRKIFMYPLSKCWGLTDLFWKIFYFAWHIFGKTRKPFPAKAYIIIFKFSGLYHYIFPVSLNCQMNSSCYTWYENSIQCNIRVPYFCWGAWAMKKDWSEYGYKFGNLGVYYAYFFVLQF